eukprot:gene15463-4646_t
MATSSTPVNPALCAEFRMTLTYSIENIPEYNTRLRIPTSYAQFLAAVEKDASGNLEASGGMSDIILCR